MMARGATGTGGGGEAAPSRLRRLPLRWSLRTMLLLLTAVALGLGWYCNRAQRQQRAVAAIVQQGGRVLYTHQLPGRTTDPPWLSRYLGMDYADTLGNVELIGSQFDDDDLVLLDDLPGVQWIRLHETKVTGRRFDCISRQTGLTWLVVKDSPIRGDALRHLRPLHRLETLYLEGTAIGDADLAHLKGLTELKDLSLNETQVGDAGMVSVAELTKLKELHLEQTRLTDKGLVTLAPLQKLERITVYGTAITDESVGVLLSWTLKDAAVGQTGITPAGLKRLKAGAAGQSVVGIPESNP